MLLFLEQCLNGLQLGLLLFLLSAGLTLIFGIMDLVNLAHGSFYMIGAYFAATFVAWTGNFIIGVLLAKDLLRLQSAPTFKLRDYLRPVVFIPESKRLNVLLREFRVSHHHMAVVIDEYAGVCGLITIEDVLEQIVGDIEDEYDFDEADDNIRLDQNGRYRVKAQTAIADFNAAFATHFSDAKCNTVGGLILQHLGRVPKRNEAVDLDGLRFRVLRADSRRLYTLLVSIAQDADVAA